MAHSEARAWWADVQYLRDDYERTDEARRRADEADLASRRATREHRRAEADRGQPRSEHSDAVLAPRRSPDASFAPRRGQHSAADVEPRRAQAADPPPEPRRVAHVKGAATPGRRTIEIRGRTTPAPAVPRSPDLERRRPPRRAVERVGARPDKVAMWALLMGLMLILVAIGTADTPAVIAFPL